MTALALTKRTQRGLDDPLPLQRLLQQIRTLALSFRLRGFETALVLSFQLRCTRLILSHCWLAVAIEVGTRHILHSLFGHGVIVTDTSFLTSRFPFPFSVPRFPFPLISVFSSSPVASYLIPVVLSRD